MAYSTLRSGSDRTEKWLARFKAGSQSTSVVLTRQLEEGEALRARVLASNEATFNMEGEVRQVLNEQGIVTIFAGQYLNFGRQMLKLCGRYSGEAAAVNAAILVALWAARGLSSGVLETIRSNVFGVAAPAGPVV